MNRPSRLVVDIPTPSSDGRYYAPYPHGDAPPGVVMWTLDWANVTLDRTDYTLDGGSPPPGSP